MTDGTAANTAPLCAAATQIMRPSATPAGKGFFGTDVPPDLRQCNIDLAMQRCRGQVQVGVNLRAQSGAPVGSDHGNRKFPRSLFNAVEVPGDQHLDPRQVSDVL